MKIIEVYLQEEKFNPRLNCTVSGAWVAKYENGIEVAICRDYEASNSKEALAQNICPPFPPATGAVPWTPKQIREYDQEQRNQLPQALL